jgi:multiple sugar transport system permease protein
MSLPAATTANTRLRQVTGPAGAAPCAQGPLFVAPFMVLFVLLFLAPLGYAAYLSLFQEKLIGGTSFVGLDNYVTALKDPQLLRASAGSRCSS